MVAKGSTTTLSHNPRSLNDQDKYTPVDRRAVAAGVNMIP